MATSTSVWERWEEAVAAGFRGWTRPRRGGPDREVDLVSKDGRFVIETKYSIGGARDLRASLAQLAVYAGAHPDLTRAIFIVRLPRMSPGRVMEEWLHLSAVLRPEVSRRLGIVAVAPDDVVVIPDDPETQRIAEHVRKIAADFWDDERTEGGPVWSRKSYEIWKVLLAAWLAGERALPLHELQRRSGASYPSVSNVLDRLETLGELERGSNRSAALTGLPTKSLSEVLALGDQLRETHRFVDRSGRAPNATDLIRRIRAKAPDVALGGVEGARNYMPTFNLNGYPRVDVTVEEGVEFGWTKRVDPALGEAESADASGVRLVVHRLRRPESEFTRTPRGLFADRAEVLLDLHELRLGEQADEFVNAMREKRIP